VDRSAHVRGEHLVSRLFASRASICCIGLEPHEIDNDLKKVAGEAACTGYVTVRSKRCLRRRFIFGIRSRGSLRAFYENTLEAADRRIEPLSGIHDFRPIAVFGRDSRARAGALLVGSSWLDVGTRLLPLLPRGSRPSARDSALDLSAPILELCQGRPAS